MLGQGGMGIVYLVRSVSSQRRFAVKRATPSTAGERRDLLQEIQTWLRLPSHPNVAACRFFTTIDEEIVVFTEYVEGGSLGDWIGGGRLCELDEILVVAIGAAWGLDAIHACGVIHQDVKPANILMTAGGRPLIADFGLARRRYGGPSKIPIGTPAYCSPEQSRGERLTPASDLWSWGLAVLEMFTRRATWLSGTLAAEVLEDALAAAPGERDGVAIPEEVARVLRRCFAAEPAARWRSLGEAAAELAAVHQKRTGRSAPLAPPVPAEGAAPGEELYPVEESSRASAAAEIARCTSALKDLESQRPDARRDVAALGLLLAKGRAHIDGGDLIGAGDAYEAAEKLARLPIAADGAQRFAELARALAGRGLVDYRSGRREAARAHYASAGAIREHLLAERWDSGVAYDLAVTNLHQAIAAHSVGEFAEADDGVDRALELLLARQARETPDALNDVATALVVQGTMLTDRGELLAGLRCFDRAIATRESLIRDHGRRDLLGDLAQAYANKATALMALGDHVAARLLYRRAIEIRGDSGAAESPDHWRALATTCLNAARGHEEMGDTGGASQLCNRAVEHLTYAVETLGALALRGDLAWAKLRERDMLAQLGHRPPVRDMQQEFAVLEAEAGRTGRVDLAQALTWARRRFQP